MWQIINTETNNVLKTYPNKYQAIIWCYLNGFACCVGRLGTFLDGRVAIREVLHETSKT